MAQPAPADRQARADRILDTAKDLLLRWGYRRITIDEIAKRAGVGKGTVYLHWRTREELFFAVGTREAAAMTDTVVTAMRAEPTEISLHRYMRLLFVEAMRRPVLRAIFTRDADTLGNLLSQPARQPLETAKLVATHEYLTVLAAHGLLREGLRPEDADYPLTTIVFGFFGVEPLLPPDLELELDEKADHLAEVLHRVFGPTELPASERFGEAAEKVIAIFEQLAREYRHATYGGRHE